MKKYEKNYEDLFRNERTLKKCKIEKIKAEGFPVIEEYQSELKESLHNFQTSIFDHLVLIYWLFNRFRYNGQKRKRFGNGHALDAAFAVFLRNVIGFDTRLITSNHFFSAIMSYIYDFFPDFDLGNPFEQKYKYPYKYMTLECLVAVYQIPERMELLKEGEDKRMSYVEFMDYVVNYILSYNLDSDSDTYTLRPANGRMMYLIFKRLK